MPLFPLFGREASPEPFANAGEIRDLMSCRPLSAIRVPAGWSVPEYEGFERREPWTVREPRSVEGRSTFGNRPMLVTAHPAIESIPRIGINEDLAYVTLSTARLGISNIIIGDVRVAEHLISLYAGMGLTVRWSLTRSSAPSFPGGMREVLNAVRPAAVKLPAQRMLTPNGMVGVKFANGAYLILLPDDGSGRLVVDHMIDHDSSVLGVQRMIVDVTAPRFAYLARARTLAYGARTRFAEQWVKLRPQGIPGLGLDFDNVLFVNHNRILNPNPEFDIDGKNYEFMAHSVVDKVAALGLLGALFVGTLVTFRTSHRMDLIALRRLAPFLKRCD